MYAHVHVCSINIVYTQACRTRQTEEMTREDTRSAETSKQVHPVKHFAGTRLQMGERLLEHVPGLGPAHLLLNMTVHEQARQENRHVSCFVQASSWLGRRIKQTSLIGHLTTVSSCSNLQNQKI